MNFKLFQSRVFRTKFKIQNLLEYGFYLLIFFLPWQTHLILRPGQWQGKFGAPWPVDYWTISLFGIDILLIILLVLFICLFGRNLENKNEEVLPTDKKENWFNFLTLNYNRKIWFILGFLELALFISIFFAPDKSLAVYKYIIFLLGLGLFWLSSSDFYNKTKIFLALFLALFLQGALAIWQFLNQGSLGSKWLGMAAHTAGEPGASVIEVIGSDGKIERWLRSYGSLDHPNMLGGFLAIGLIFLFQTILNYQRKDNKKTDLKFIIYHLSFIIAFAGLLLTFSRGAMLAALVGLVIIFAETVWKKDKIKISRAVGAGIFALVLAAFFIFNYSSLFFIRTSPNARLEIKSISERKMYLNDSDNLIKGSHFLGVGAGNYTVKLSKIEAERPFYQWQPVHNVFLLILAEAGISGLLFFSIFLFYLFFLFFRQKNLFALSVLLAVCIIIVLDHYFWSLHFGQLFIFLIFGMLIRNFKEKYGGNT